MLENQEHYRDLVENSLDLMCTHDLNGLILTVNLAAARTLGYEPAELVNRNIREFLSPRSHPEFAAFLLALPEQRVAKGYLRLLTKTGETRIWSFTSTLRTEGGQDRFVRGVAHDVTEILQVQKALRKSEERSRQIVNASPVAMLVTHGIEQKNELVNDKFTALFGYSIADVPDVAQWWSLAYPDESSRDAIRTEWQARVTKAIKNRSTIVPMEGKVRCKDGSYRFVEFHLASLGETNLVSFVDLTDRKNAQHELERVGGRLLQAQEEERSRIARDLHDDICQQLALLAIDIDRFAEIPNEAPIPVRDHIARLRKRASEITRDLRAMSHELHPSRLEMLGLKVALQGLCEEFGKLYKVKIAFVAEQLPAPVPEDISICLFRVAQEALRNGVKHSRATQFVVQLIGAPDAIHLLVRDDGVGFDPEITSNHSGLGLISIRERLTLVRGTIEIRSKPRGGTEIRCSAPLIHAVSATVKQSE